jgi:hypothetical protein
VHLETTLNLAWLFLGIYALARVVRVTFGKAGCWTRKSRWLHTVGAALVVVALFPYISATDDVLRIEHFNAQHDTRHPAKQTQTDNLIRLYEAMDSPLIWPVSEVALVFFFIFLVFTPVAKLTAHIAPLHAGRSPPFATF